MAAESPRAAAQLSICSGWNGGAGLVELHQFTLEAASFHIAGKTSRIGSVTYIEQSRLTNLCPKAIAHFLTICQTISRSTGVPRASLRLEFHGQRTDQQPSGLRADLEKIIHLCLVAQFSRDMVGLYLLTEVKARSYVIQLQFGCESKHHPRPPRQNRTSHDGRWSKRPCDRAQHHAPASA
jgi:hypothetical protein